MCGICGVISKKVNKNVLDDMTDAMQERGPNARGVYVASVCNREVGLGHRRLSIFDTSSAANQPFFSYDGRYVVVFNGEIYNFKEIRDELIKVDGNRYTYRTNCDTEVLLNAYIRWGKEAFPKFNGMFAFAILDNIEGTLVLGRDRMGVKPLYYSQQGGDFFFASDLAALMVNPDFVREIDSTSLHYYLWNMCIPAPNTIFKNTYKLDAGEYLEIDIASMKVLKNKWWDIRDVYLINERAAKCDDSDYYLDLIEKDITKAVSLRLEADVPVGVFLSGGIDSSLVTAIASKLHNGDVDTFSIGFNEAEYNEAGYAEEIAKHLGTKHHSLYCSIKEARNLIREIPKAYSEPFADNSQIPMMLLSKLTHDNVTVALSGDGGDEFFLGYPNVISNAELYKHKNINELFRVLTAPVSNYLEKDIFSHKTWKINKLRNATGANSIINLDYITANVLVNSVLRDELRNNRDSWFAFGIVDEDTNGTEEFIKKHMLRDMTLGLEGDMLAKVDRATMHYSLEARCPLLDYHVIEDSFKIPLDVKYRDKTLKFVLKNLLYRYVPRELVNRPKQGFGIPINKWLHEKTFMDGFEKYFESEYLEEQGIFSIEGILKFKDAFDKNVGPMVDRVMWTYIVFQMWWEEYMV